MHGISHHTVGDHVKAIYKKLAVSSRGEAISEAAQSGLESLQARARKLGGALDIGAGAPGTRGTLRCPASQPLPPA